MRKALFILFLSFLGIACTCKKDCQNGDCFRGDCICINGWDGKNCDVRARVKFYGEYSTLGKELCNSGLREYGISISESMDSDTSVTINNFYNQGWTVSAMVGDDDITIPEQVIGSITISGNGLLDADNQVLTLNYSVDDGSDPVDSCWVEMMKH